FQAEDGIRDLTVTGVQTCALPICGGECVEAPLIGSYEKAGVDVFLFDTVSEDGQVGSTGLSLDAGVVAPLADRLTRPFLLAGGKIGRASCRERGWSAGGGVALERK